MANDKHAILEKIRRGERVDHYETVRMGKNGKSISISLTGSPIHGEGGELIGASSIARDITERRSAEGQGLSASQYARGLIEASLDSLVTSSPESYSPPSPHFNTN